MNSLMLMTGVDIPIPELQLALHQPTVREISYMGELDYYGAIQSICFNKDTILANNPQGTNSLQTMNNFQIFMTLISDPKVKDSSKRNNDVMSVFAIFFPKYKATILPRSIYLNNQETKQNVVIDENNFDALRNIIEEVAGLKNTVGGQNATFNPKDKKAAEIAAQLMKGRARAAKSKNDMNSDGVLSRYVSILTIGLNSMSLDDCLNLTVYQVYDLIERYGLYIGWDLDIRSRLAGGNPDQKPDDWMKDIH